MNLKEIRINKGFSQRELAKTLGVGPSTVCQWESGKREPSIAVVKQIATILCCSADELLGIEKAV